MNLITGLSHAEVGESPFMSDELSATFVKLMKATYSIAVKLFKAISKLPSSLKMRLADKIGRWIGYKASPKIQAACVKVEEQTTPLRDRTTVMAATGAAIGGACAVPLGAIIGGVSGALYGAKSYFAAKPGQSSSSTKGLMSKFIQVAKTNPEIQQLFQAVKTSAKNVASGAGVAIFSSVATSMLTDNVVYIAAAGIATVVATRSDSVKTLANRATSFVMSASRAVTSSVVNYL